MAHRINFTKKNIDNLTPKDNDSFYQDTQVQGLRLIISKNGIYTFQVYMRFNGQPTKRKIGRYPQTSPELARQKAKEYILSMLQGIDPKKKNQNDPSYDEIWLPYLAYLEDKVQQKPKTAMACLKHHMAVHKRYVKFHDKKLSYLTFERLRDFHRDYSINKGYKTMANEVIRQIRACFNYANIDVNPAKLVKLNKQVSRKKYLAPEDMPAFLSSLFADSQADFRDVFLLCLYTASRIGAVMSMEWEDINFKYGIWEPVTKSSQSTKDTTPIGLVGRAVDILRRRKLAATDSRWVFPSNSKLGYITYPNKVFARIIERAGLKGFVPHDLRHTAVTWFASASASNQELLTLLGNKSMSTVGIYTHMNVTVVKERYNTVVERIIGDLDPGLQKIMNADSA